MISMHAITHDVAVDRFHIISYCFQLFATIIVVSAVDVSVRTSARAIVDGLAVHVAQVSYIVLM